MMRNDGRRLQTPPKLGRHERCPWVNFIRSQTTKRGRNAQAALALATRLIETDFHEARVKLLSWSRSWVFVDEVEAAA